METQTRLGATMKRAWDPSGFTLVELFVVISNQDQPIHGTVPRGDL
jgi:hypothetical protein